MDASRERAKVFESVAETYDRSRPAYPDAVIDKVLGTSPRGLSVLDVGCGTGIASRLIAERGADVLGIDLNAGMAEIAERRGIRTEVAAFETWDPAGRSFDRVTCAQAWHWLDPRASSDKAASVLKSGGRLCLFWSVGCHPPALADALHAAYRRALPSDAPGLLIGYAANRAHDDTVDFGLVVDGLRPCSELTELELESFPWNRRYTRDEWLDQLQTHSDHAALPPELRRELLDAVGRTIDEFGGAFVMSFVTVLISTVRR